MKRIFLIAGVLALTLTGCGGGGGGKTQPEGTQVSPGTSVPSRPSLEVPDTSMALIWSHIGTYFGEEQVWYVARVTNHGGSAVAVTLDARALDASGTIVGSDRPTLPDIPAGARFDYFGNIGAGFTELTGKPVKIDVTEAERQAGAVAAPLLGTSEVKLTSGSPADTETPYSYNLSVKVTNTTKGEIGFVTQQVVLYDAGGRVVGGGTGTSDNVPDVLPPGLSYREQWTGIPALRRATSVRYSVWSSSF